MSEIRLNRVRTGVVAGILMISGAILLALPVLAMRFASTPFPGFFIDPNLVASATGEPHFIGKNLEPIISYPHRLLTLDGEPIENNRQFYQRLQGYEFQEVINLTFDWQFEANSAYTEELMLTNPVMIIPLTKLTASDLWNQFWLYYLCAVIIFGMGLWAFWIRPWDEASQVFALFTAVGAINIGALFDLITTQQILAIWVFVLPLSGGFLLWLSLIYPHETAWLEKAPWIRWGVLSIGIGIGVWGVLWLNHSDPRAYVEPWRFGYLLNAVGLVGGLGMMAYRGIASPSPIIKQQGRLIFSSGVVAFLPIILFFVLSSTPVEVPWLTTSLYIPPVLIYPFAIAYTIIRYGLLDIKAVRRGVAYATLTAVLVLVFALVASGITATFGDLSDSPWLISAAVIFVAFLFEPLRSRLQTGLDQMFFRRSVTLDGLQRTYNRELLTAVEFSNVADLLLDFIKQGVPETETILYTLNRREGLYRNYQNPSDISVRADSELAAFLADSGNLIDLSEEQTWPTVVRNNPILLKEKRVNLLVPLGRETTLLGWLALSAVNGREVITQNEMSYISSLADQSLLGLERASVERQLQDRVTELDQLSNFSQFLAFTIDTEDLFELVFTNNQRLLDIDDFFICIKDSMTQKIYNTFYIENDERIKAKEGRNRLVSIPNVQKAVLSGQVEKWVDGANGAWIAAPLNVGAETLGAVYTVMRNPNNVLGPQRERLFLTYAQRTAVALERLQTSERLTEQAQRLQIINQVTLSLSSTLELRPLLKLIMDKSIELFDAQAGSLLLSDSETGELVFEIVRGPAEAELLHTRLPVGTGIAGTAAQTARSIITNDVSEDARWFSDLDEENHFHTRSILTVPLLRNNRVLGVVQVINKGSGARFDEHDEGLLNAFASQAVVALENARLVEQTDQKLQTSVEELSMLQQLDRDLNTSLALETVLNITLGRLMKMVGGSAGSIVLKDVEDLPQIRSWRNYDRGFDPTAVSPKKLENSLAGRVLSSGRSLLVDNVHEENGYIQARFETLAQLILPLNHQRTVIGAIVIESDEMNGFTTEEENTAVRIANHAAIAIANALLYEQVKEANLAKSEFVSMVSHELKTPMTAVRGYVDLMLSGMMGTITDQQQEYLEIVSANISRMGQQIQDLTDISRIETGRLHMELKPLDLQMVLDDTMKTMRSLCEEKSIQLHIEVPETLPLVEADKGRLVQVMTNLLSNACKYSPEETAVTVRFSQDKLNEKDVVCVAVKDSGYGISPEDQEKLFTKFFRSDDPNIRKAKGTGLGLSITKGIIELHGGEMWFDSAIGAGTTFFFSIPIEQGDDE